MANILDMGLFPFILYVSSVTIILMFLMAMVGIRKMRKKPKYFLISMIFMIPLGFVIAAGLYMDTGIASFVQDIFGQFG